MNAIRDDITEQLKIRQKELLCNAARKYKRVFLYGAGNISRAYIDVLEMENIKISGLIVSQKTHSFLNQYPIFSAVESRDELKESDCVVLAFMGANKNEIINALLPAQPQIISLDHLAILSLDDDIRLKPILSWLNIKFGCAIKEFAFKDIKNIFVVRLDLIGDFVFTTSFLRELRNNFPKQNITLVVRKQNYDLAKNCPYIDNLISYDCPFQEGDLSRQCENIDLIKERVNEFYNNVTIEKQDVVFFPRELLSGRNVLDELLIGYYCGARVRIGRQLDLNEVYGDNLYHILMKNSFSFISRHSEAMHETEYSLEMLRDLGLCISKSHMELWPSADDYVSVYAERVRNAVGKKIALGIVASVQRRTWSPENYIELLKKMDTITDSKNVFVLFGGKDASGAADTILHATQNLRNVEVISLVEKTTLLQSLACISLCNIYVGSNTGLLHFASAMNIPSVTIYAELSDGKPTDGDAPERMGAWQVPHIDLIPKSGLDGCHGVCRMDYSHCINQIKTDQVVEAILQIL